MIEAFNKAKGEIPIMSNNVRLYGNECIRLVDNQERALGISSFNDHIAVTSCGPHDGR